MGSADSHPSQSYIYSVRPGGVAHTFSPIFRLSFNNSETIKASIACFGTIRDLYVFYIPHKFREVRINTKEAITSKLSTAVIFGSYRELHTNQVEFAHKEGGVVRTQPHPLCADVPTCLHTSAHI